jgi:mono/diheme cytochrome c family protein
LKGGVDDPFETGGIGGYRRLNNCMRCHDNSPSHAVRRAGLRTAYPPHLKEGRPETISKATATRKRDDVTWKAMHALWRADTTR